MYTKGFSGGSVVKNPPTEMQEMGLIPGLGRSSGEGNGNPLQNSCLGIPTDCGAWWATVQGVAKMLDVTERLNNTRNYLESVCF